MDTLCEKHEEEIQRIREQMKNELRVQNEQLKNMLESNMKSAKQDRQLLVQQNQDLQNQFLAFQKANEDNMKEIGKLRDLLAKQYEEKRKLSEQVELNAQNASERQEKIRAEMEERHKREQAKLRREMEINIEKNLQEYKAALAATEQDKEKTKKDLEVLKSQYQTKLEEITNMQGEMNETKEELAELKKPGFVYQKISEGLEYGGSGLKKIKDNCPLMWQVPRSLF